MNKSKTKTKTKTKTNSNSNSNSNSKTKKQLMSISSQRNIPNDPVYEALSALKTLPSDVLGKINALARPRKYKKMPADTQVELKRAVRSKIRRECMLTEDRAIAALADYYYSNPDLMLEDAKDPSYFSKWIEFQMNLYTGGVTCEEVYPLLY